MGLEWQAQFAHVLSTIYQLTIEGMEVKGWEPTVMRQTDKLGSSR